MSESAARPQEPDDERLADDVLETSRLIVELMQAAYAARHATPGLTSGEGGGAEPAAAGPSTTGPALVRPGDSGNVDSWAGGAPWDAPRYDATGSGASQMGAHAARVAMHVYRHGTRTIGELATGLGISYGWASRVVERLELAGIVTRERDATDRRVVHVRLKQSAIGSVEAAYRWHGDAVADALEPLSDDERAAVRLFLERLAARLTEGARRQG